MAAFSSEVPARKRQATYGKASRKKLPFTHAIESKRAAFSEPRDVTPTGSVADIFDVPSSDDEERVTETRKRKLRTKPTPVKRVRLNRTASSARESNHLLNSKASALAPKTSQNQTIKTPGMLTQSELRMGAVRKPVAEQMPKRQIQRPKHGLISQQVQDIKQEPLTVTDQLASVTLYTPKKKPAPRMDDSMSSSSSQTSQPSPSPVSQTPQRSPSPITHAMPISRSPVTEPQEMSISRVAQTPQRPLQFTSQIPQMSPSPVTPASDRPRQMSISPEGKRMWEGLLGDSNPAHANKRRRKLIDSLKEQLEDTEDSDSAESQTSSQKSESVSTTRIESHSQSTWERMEQTDLTHQQQPIMTRALPASSSQSTGPRTYKSHRAFLSEPALDFESQLAMDMPLESTMGSRRQGRGQVPALKPLDTFQDAEDEVVGGAPRRVHEARMAGAKNHFVDGVDNLFDDIATPQPKPSAKRRSGLMDLATRLLQNDYRQQFLENGLDHRLFLHLGQETDIVAGLLLASLLFTTLSDDVCSISIDQLRRQGISRLLIRLLEVQDSLPRIARDRKHNMSKGAQSLLAEYQTLLVNSDFWGKPDQIHVSPRTVALRCIELMSKKTREVGNIGNIISNEMTRKLFEIIQDSSSENLPELWKDENFRLALSTIEYNSQIRMTDDASAWIDSYLPYVSGLLLKTLSEDMPRQIESEFRDYFQTLLHLVVSVTHSNEKASNVFSNQDLMAAMGATIVANWKRMSEDVSEDEKDMAETVLALTTVAMLNIVDTSRLARQSFIGLADSGNDCLAEMVHVFNDRGESSSQAASLEDAAQNVPLGYLTCTLGYLCQEPSLKEQIVSHLPAKRISPLRLFINDFFMMLKKVDDITERDPAQKANDTEQLKSLEAMVDAL